jgi:hypothetical protein
MAQTIQLRRSTTAAAVPASLAAGEVAINETDGKLFYRLSGVVTAFTLNATYLTTTVAASTYAPIASPTFTGNVKYSTATNLTAAGTTQATALALTSDYNHIGTAAASSGVRLPTAVAGMEVLVFNKGANAVNVYPATGAAINALAANAALAVAAAGVTIFYAISSTLWLSK